MTIPASRRLDFSEIPVIDLANLIDHGEHEPTIEAINRACREVGFFYIKNHGVPPSLIEELQGQAKLLFDQTTEQKMQIAISPQIRGYLPLYYRSYEGEHNAGTSHQEGFWIGYETSLDARRPLDGPNQWPAQPETLRSVMLEYFAETVSLSQVLMRGFSQALGLPRSTLENWFNHPTSRLKLNHYPPQNNPQNVNNIGVVPHSDSGGFTILWQDHHGGLEVQSKNGDWVGAPPIENTFVVNIGDILQIWSNGRFSSTPHRVINRGNNDRYSIPLFVNPDSDVVIKPLVDLGQSQFDEFMYGEYQQALWRRTFPVANIQ